MAAHHELGLTPAHASHVRECPDEISGALRGSSSSLTISSSPMSGEGTRISMRTEHNPRCPCSHYVIRFHDRIVNVLEEVMAEAGAIKGTSLRLKVCRIMSRASRDRHGEVVWLDFCGYA
jgi:hypothetical protein